MNARSIFFTVAIFIETRDTRYRAVFFLWSNVVVQDRRGYQRNSRPKITSILGERVKKITRAHINFSSCMHKFLCIT